MVLKRLQKPETGTIYDLSNNHHGRFSYYFLCFSILYLRFLVNFVPLNCLTKCLMVFVKQPTWYLHLVPLGAPFFFFFCHIMLHLCFPWSVIMFFISPVLGTVWAFTCDLFSVLISSSFSCTCSLVHSSTLCAMGTFLNTSNSVNNSTSICFFQVWQRWSHSKQRNTWRKSG